MKILGRRETATLLPGILTEIMKYGLFLSRLMYSHRPHFYLPTGNPQAPIIHRNSVIALGLLNMLKVDTTDFDRWNVGFRGLQALNPIQLDPSVDPSVYTIFF
jgi:hypothetical protein